MNKKKVWFITGASGGLGRALAEEVLSFGERVIATARKPEVLRDLIEKYPETARAVRLDVTDRANVKEAVGTALEEFGRLDVVVNNAGYGLIGAIEEPSDEQIRRQFETNVFGVLNVVRETLPVLRGQKSGHIINISSYTGFVAFPSYGYYSATKFALQGLSDSLAQEVAPLGIRVTIAEPGGMRSGFIDKGVVKPEKNLSAEYPSTAGFIKLLEEVDGRRLSDPHEIAKILISAAGSENPPLHLPLGEDSYDVIENHLAALAKEISLRRKKGIVAGSENAAD